MNEGVHPAAPSGARPPIRREPALDGLRACAALAVLLTHVGFQTAHNVGGFLGSVTARLDLGVAIFFALSGYLLGRPYVRWVLGATGRPALGTYALRRVARIVPAYVVLLVLVRVVMAPTGLATRREWVEQFMFLQVYGRDRLVLGATHLWSLAVEVSFYVALPLLAVLAHRAIRRRETAGARARALLWCCLGAAVLSIVWPVTYVHGSLDPLLAPLWLPATAAWFAAGLACATLGAASEHGIRFRLFDEAARAGGSCWLLGAAAFLLATTEIAGPRFLEARTGAQESLRVTLFAVVALSVLLPLTYNHRPWWGSRVLSSPIMAWLGRISYGVFLYQLVALDLAFRALGYDRFTGFFIPVLTGTVTLTLAMAAVSWYVVERPVLALAHRRRPASPGSAEAGRRPQPPARPEVPAG